MEKKADIIPFLESVVEKNTRSYQSDFAYDEKRLQAAMLEMYQEDRTFLWMSRPGRIVSGHITTMTLSTSKRSASS